MPGAGGHATSARRGALPVVTVSNAASNAIKQAALSLYFPAGTIDHPFAGASLSTVTPQRGFTLVELVMVISIIGLLAVVAIPRFQDRSAFDNAGFRDQTMAALRYAQKAAIAQRRTVCVAFAANSVSLTIASAAGVATCSDSLTGPGGQPFVFTASGAAKFTAIPASMSFNSLGIPNAAASINVEGVGTPIIVERETGYVHL
jgi:MSHA pilin protein MshC